MDTKILDPNDISNVAPVNSDIKRTTGVYNDSDAPTPIFTTNPTPEVETDNKHKYIEDDDENYKVKKV